MAEEAALHWSVVSIRESWKEISGVNLVKAVRFVPFKCRSFRLVKSVVSDQATEEE